MNLRSLSGLVVGSGTASCEVYRPSFSFDCWPSWGSREDLYFNKTSLSNFRTLVKGAEEMYNRNMKKINIEKMLNREGFLSVERFAEDNHFSDSYVRRLCREKKLVCQRIEMTGGSKWFVSKSAKYKRKIA